MFTPKTISSCSLPAFNLVYLTYLPSVGESPSVSTFILLGKDSNSYSCILTNGIWVGSGIQEDGFTISPDFTLELINIFKEFNFV
jgi:hypothetical protein